MSWASAAEWNTHQAVEIAFNISSLPSVYCGPASIAWIAAVWNQQKGRPYRYIDRLRDKSLFPDGPRLFHGIVPGFEKSLNDLLIRETEGELRIAREIYFGPRALHGSLIENKMPMIVRMKAPKFRDGLHYVTLYKSERRDARDESGQLQLHWQDNGLYGGESSRGLSASSWQSARGSLFFWGAKRIVVHG